MTVLNGHLRCSQLVSWKCLFFLLFQKGTRKNETVSLNFIRMDNLTLTIKCFAVRIKAGTFQSQQTPPTNHTTQPATSFLKVPPQLPSPLLALTGNTLQSETLSWQQEQHESCKIFVIRQEKAQKRTPALPKNPWHIIQIQPGFGQFSVCEKVENSGA